MAKKGLIFIFMFVVLLAGFFLSRAEYHSEAGLSVVSCPNKYTEHVVVLDFMVDAGLASQLDSKILEAWIRDSNLTLENSCIPIRRILGSIIVTDNRYGDYMTEALDERVLWKLKKQESQRYHFNNNARNVLVFVVPDNSDYDLLGTTWPKMYPNFVLLTNSANGLVLEHELGHLAGADHEKSVSEKVLGRLSFFSGNSNKAAAVFCGSQRTIMHSEVDIEKTVPVYSSANIYFSGKRCGNDNFADNRQILIDYYAHFFPDIRNEFKISE